MTGSMAEGDTCSIYLIRRGQKNTHAPTELLTIPDNVLPSPILQGQKQRMRLLTLHAAPQHIFPLHCLLDINPIASRLAGYADFLFLQFMSIHFSQANQTPPPS